MTTTKVFIGTRFNSERNKQLKKIAKKLHISKNAVIENAFDIYAEDVLGDNTSDNSDNSDNTSDNSDNTSDNTIRILEERIKLLELTISELQPKVITPVITPNDNTKEAQGDNTSDNTKEAQAIEVITPVTPPDTTTTKITLTKAEFLAKFNFKGDADDVLYSQAAQQGKSADGWLSPEGDRWFMYGSRSNRVWSNAAEAEV